MSPRRALLVGAGVLLVGLLGFVGLRVLGGSDGAVVSVGSPTTVAPTSAAPGSTTPPVVSTIPALRPPSRIAPAQGALIGLSSVPPGDFSRGAVEAQWERRETDSGRTLDIGHSFYPFEKDFPTWREEFHIAQGRTPLISWNGTDTLDIVSGLHDELIADRARRVAALGVPVLIRWFWEMDASFKLERARDPQSYAAALERIQKIFTAEGADLVEWVWCPTAFDWDVRATADWYPGADLVDWVCADGYNFAPTKPGAEWRDFATIFSGFYDWAAETGKPIMIGEFGAQERAPGDKAAWLDDIVSTVPEQFPLIRALVYFDVDRTELEGYDWTLETSEDAYGAFLRLVNDPYFVTRGP